MNSSHKSTVSQAKVCRWATVLVAVLLASGRLGGEGQAATVTIGLTYADAPVTNPSGVAFANGTGSVRLGAFYDQVNATFYSSNQLQTIWQAGNSQAFEALKGSFVPIASQTFNRSIPGHFRFSSMNPLETEVDLTDSIVDLGGKQMFIFMSDSLPIPTSFAILAVNQSLVDDILLPSIPTGDGLDKSWIGTIEAKNINSAYFDTTIIAGQLETNQLRMVAVPASSAGPVLNGQSDVTHFWENGVYTDPGVTASGSVATVITDGNNQTVANLTAMSSTLGVYTITYTANGMSTTRTVRVKIQNPTADVDNDGLSNLMEYWLGGSLASNDNSKLPVATVVGSELILTFTARADITTGSQIALGFVATTSLSVPFSPAALTQKTGVSQAGVLAGFTKQQWSLSTSGADKKFARITVTVPSSLSGA
jgi:hypothetical protein